MNCMCAVQGMGTLSKGSVLGPTLSVWDAIQASKHTLAQSANAMVAGA